MTNDERAQIRAEAVREVLEIINMRCAGSPNHHRYQNAILELLPKPDPVKELLDELQGPNSAMSLAHAHGAYWALKRLFDTGRLKP